MDILTNTKNCFQRIVFQIELLVISVNFFWWCPRSFYYESSSEAGGHSLNLEPNVQLLASYDINIQALSESALFCMKARDISWFGRWRWYTDSKYSARNLWKESKYHSNLSTILKGPTTSLYTIPTQNIMTPLPCWQRSRRPGLQKASSHTLEKPNVHLVELCIHLALCPFSPMQRNFDCEILLSEANWGTNFSSSSIKLETPDSKNKFRLLENYFLSKFLGKPNLSRIEKNDTPLEPFIRGGCCVERSS